MSEYLQVFIEPPLLVSYLGCAAIGWSSSERGWRKLAWIGAGLGFFAIAFALVFLGVRW